MHLFIKILLKSSFINCIAHSLKQLPHYWNYDIERIEYLKLQQYYHPFIESRSILGRCVWPDHLFFSYVAPLKLSRNTRTESFLTSIKGVSCLLSVNQVWNNNPMWKTTTLTLFPQRYTFFISSKASGDVLFPECVLVFIWSYD